VDDVAGSLRAEGLEPSPVASELADALWRAGSRRDRWQPCCSPTTARHDGCRSVCRRQRCISQQPRPDVRRRSGTCRGQPELCRGCPSRRSRTPAISNTCGEIFGAVYPWAGELRGVDIALPAAVHRVVLRWCLRILGPGVTRAIWPAVPSLSGSATTARRAMPSQIPGPAHLRVAVVREARGSVDSHISPAAAAGRGSVGVVGGIGHDGGRRTGGPVRGE